ncbi:conserved hypothetical protein [Bradyrhizobium sp. STM 3843]|uniref:hypothetical protein n=1 Tax=Bradyrhizobium sp. STM 3843 TaxID=551947 RepID=UPI0002406C17|nr:hypothetical protein [Bradyrhizobium sp. STM 3843]CCE06185.1 conserved hypothetical protein [Bradyrhizobium sp. STM 3843]
MSVIEHDFGLKQRESERRFRKLLSLDALHEANVRANPVPYLERASERIYQLEKALFDALQAATLQADDSADTITVSKADYQRLLNCRAIVAAAFDGLVSDDNENPAQD